MIDGLLEALGAVGYAFDTPGALLRGALIGRPGERASGREMLEALGYSANQEGLDLGDVLGFGAEMVLDPLNLLPGYAALKGAKHLKRTKALNKASDALLEAGGMPAEIAARTLVRDPVTGQPTRLYHGTKTVFDKFDAKSQDAGVFNDFDEVAAYLTDGPELASDYAMPQGTGVHGVGPITPDYAGNVRMQFADVRKPFVNEGDELLQLSKMAGTPDSMPEDIARYIETNYVNQADSATASRNRSRYLGYAPAADAALKIKGSPYTSNDIKSLVKALIESEGRHDYILPPNRRVYSALGHLHEDVQGVGLIRQMQLDNFAATKPAGAIPMSPHFQHSAANEHLRNLGYDAIQHTGSKRVGGRGFAYDNVTIPFDVDQIYSPWVVPDRIAETRGAYPGAILGFETAKAANQYKQNQIP
jgi:hypothetical protein